MNLAPALAEAPLWTVTSYFNTQGFRLRRENYRRFRRHLRAPLATIEWSPTGRFELGDDEADLMVRVEGGSPMWQKERLLNLLIPRLPPACRAVAWLDCDVVFNREDWVGATLQALERHTLVQLFEHAHHLTEAGSARLDEADWSALPHELSRQGVVAACPPPLSLGEWARQQTAVRPGGLSTGFAWAAPRAWLEQHPFIDTWLLGGGDAAFLCAALGAADAVVQRHGLNPRQAAWLRPVAERLAASVQGRIAHLEGRLYVLWHGSLQDRGYRSRHDVPARHGYDPATFIRPAPSGVWEWTEAGAVMAADVQAYLESRNEDGLRPAPAPAP